MKKSMKIVLGVVAIMLVIAVSVAGTIAYLTSKTAAVRNTFTLGNVTITLDEHEIEDEYATAITTNTVQTNEYKLIPGHTYLKDPTVHVDDSSEDCWLFVKVTNGIAGIEVDADDGDTIAEQMAALGWTPVNNSTDVYAYNAIVSGGTNVVVFNSFTIAGNADISNYATASNNAAVINIIAYAVQADGFGSSAAAWAAAPASWE